MQYFLLARHGKATRKTCVVEDAHPLSNDGRTQIEDVAGALAEHLRNNSKRQSGGKPQGIVIGKILHGTYAHTRQTAEAYQSVLELRLASGTPIMLEPQGCLDPTAFFAQDDRAAHTKEIVSQLRKTLMNATSATNGRANAILLVGHQPQLGAIAQALLTRNRRRWHPWNLWASSTPPIASAELICIATDECSLRRPWVKWTLVPSDDESFKEVREKIKSKMDTAKILGTVIAGIFTFLLGILADPTKYKGLVNFSDSDVDLLDSVGRYRSCTAGIWRDFRSLAVFPDASCAVLMTHASMAFLFLALCLYLRAMYAYDSLLMPKRFWAEALGKRHPRWLVERPPSSSAWVLFQNMMRVWRWSFSPATLSLAMGLIGLAWVASRLRSEFVIALLGVFCLYALFHRLSRPRLGVED